LKVVKKVPAAPVGNLVEFVSAADDFAVVASKGNPSESQSKSWKDLASERFVLGVL
jgi:hypothetical protein